MVKVCLLQGARVILQELVHSKLKDVLQLSQDSCTLVSQAVTTHTLLDWTINVKEMRLSCTIIFVVVFWL